MSTTKMRGPQTPRGIKAGEQPPEVRARQHMDSRLPWSERAAHLTPEQRAGHSAKSRSLNAQSRAEGLERVRRRQPSIDEHSAAAEVREAHAQVSELRATFAQLKENGELELVELDDKIRAKRAELDQMGIELDKKKEEVFAAERRLHTTRADLTEIMRPTEDKPEPPTKTTGKKKES